MYRSDPIHAGNPGGAKVQAGFSKWIFMLVALTSISGGACAENHNCGEPPDPSRYVAAPGDHEDAQHLSLDRVFSGRGRLELNMCSGELRIEPGHSDHLRLRIESQSAPSLKMRDYVKAVDVSAESVTIALEYPHKLHTVVILELPSSNSLRSEINLGAGRFYLDADGVKGNRQVNLGAGEAHLSMVGDRDYASFTANVGMGSFHDHRPGGRNSHFIVSRSYDGKGEGTLEVNVGAGSIDIDPAKGETI
jgi:hypothetical protein